MLAELSALSLESIAHGTPRPCGSLFFVFFSRHRRWIAAGCQFSATSVTSVGLRMLSSAIAATAASAHTGEPPFDRVRP